MTIATEKRNPQISIIIPCYNCEKTLREAVDSCYTQGFTEDAFEVVLVDDKSTDSTKKVMRELALEHSNINLGYHTDNQGGGATRNTATNIASSELVFCLDSDDILTPNMLSKMVQMQNETNADGIGIEISVKFKGNDVDDIAFTNTFGYRNEVIPLISLLQFNNVMCPLYSTFLYTKKAFEKIGGYPTEHGFDTQGFAWRFLAAGLTAYTCPDIVYLHRINFHESYYLREYNAGRTNINWKKILLEQNFILSDEAYTFVLNFNELDFETNIIDELKKLPTIFLTKPKLRNTNTTISVAPFSIPRNSLTGLFYRFRSRIKKYTSIVNHFVESYLNIIKRHNESGEPIYALAAWHVMRLKKKLRIDFDITQERTEDVVDLFLPTIAKDFETLQLVIEAAQKNILHTIGKIYIVTRINNEMINFCQQHGYILIDETSVLGYGKEKINYKVGSLDRSGWLLQQLLKFAADKIVKTENFISIDSDTIIIKPLSFIEDGKFIFRQNDEWHEPYFTSFRKIFGYPVKTWFSYTSHMMIFNSKMLKEMREELEEKHHQPWDEVYTSTASPEEMSCISDYDTYANWVRCNYPSKTKSIVLYNRTLQRTDLTELEELEVKYGSNYHTISFHSYASPN